ncbi:3-dehydroquinate dehydratase [Pseudomonas duriflava]|uniref:3-dehydroquinate dehydratase n=2 Tax=Pseudomonas duriflava TaxID=459528 RepID=A0A562PKW5_9PSED|nr:3-dehydroquinate dehydratase [Pseudomonas duriflava]
MQRRYFILASTAFLASAPLMQDAWAATTDDLSLSSTRTGNKPPQVKSFEVKGVSIGKGVPKIIVPITAKTPNEALEKAKSLAQLKEVDMIEFRIDHQQGALDKSAMTDLTCQLTDTLEDKPLLATFRTKAEGGEKAISNRDYAALNRALLDEGAIDLIDIEMMRDEALVRDLVQKAHDKNVIVIISNHNLHDTPPSAELIRRLRRQQALGADILKMAVMPKDNSDTLRLMNATWEMYSRYAERPLLTMAMSEEGVLSRLSGELTGSALTYGKSGVGSASGQLEAKDLHTVLNIIHSANGA